MTVRSDDTPLQVFAPGPHNVPASTQRLWSLDDETAEHIVRRARRPARGDNTLQLASEPIAPAAAPVVDQAAEVPQAPPAHAHRWRSAPPSERLPPLAATDAPSFVPDPAPGPSPGPDLRAFEAHPQQAGWNELATAYDRPLRRLWRAILRLLGLAG